MSKKIISYIANFYRDSYRDIIDYVGSIVVKNFTHTSKIIRRIRDDDLNRIFELDQKCFNRNFIHELSRYSKNFKNIFYVYEDDGIVVAYIVYYVHLRLNNFHPVLTATGFSGGVDPKFRSRGIFSLIYTESLKELQNNNVQSVYACIRKKNSASLEAHLKLGFHIIEENGKKCGQDFYRLLLKLVNRSKKNSVTKWGESSVKW